jgi:hypothetical protein
LKAASAASLYTPVAAIASLLWMACFVANIGYATGYLGAFAAQAAHPKSGRAYSLGLPSITQFISYCDIKPCDLKTNQTVRSSQLSDTLT